MTEITDFKLGNCPNGHPLEIQPKAYAYNGKFFDGLCCKVCNALYSDNDPGFKMFLEAVALESKAKDVAQKLGLPLEEVNTDSGITIIEDIKYSILEGIKAIKEAMIAKDYEWEASYHKEFMGKPNQYYFAFTKGTRSFAYWSEIEEETIVQAATKAILAEGE